MSLLFVVTFCQGYLGDNHVVSIRRDNVGDVIKIKTRFNKNVDIHLRLKSKKLAAKQLV